MRSAEVAGRIRRVGNSLAILLPSKEARRSGLHEGDSVSITVRKGVVEPLGLFKDLYDGPFDRHKGGLWRDRL